MEKLISEYFGSSIYAQHRDLLKVEVNRTHPLYKMRKGNPTILYMLYSFDFKYEVEV